MQEWISRALNRGEGEDIFKGKDERALQNLFEEHKQLRHEASGLKLQLAAKQEVLERSVARIDSLVAELRQAKVTAAEQDATIRELTKQLVESQRCEADKNSTLKLSKVEGSPFPTPRTVTVVPWQKPSSLPETPLAPRNEHPDLATSQAEPALPLPEYDNSKRSTTEESGSPESVASGESEASSSTSVNGSGSVESSHPSKKALARPRRQPEALKLFVAAEKESCQQPVRPQASHLSQELAPSCRITMAARASGEGQQPRSNGNSKKTSPNRPAAA